MTRDVRAAGFPGRMAPKRDAGSEYFSLLKRSTNENVKQYHHQGPCRGFTFRASCANLRDHWTGDYFSLACCLPPVLFAKPGNSPCSALGSSYGTSNLCVNLTG